MTGLVRLTRLDWRACSRSMLKPQAAQTMAFTTQELLLNPSKDKQRWYVNGHGHSGLTAAIDLSSESGMVGLGRRHFLASAYRAEPAKQVKRKSFLAVVAGGVWSFFIHPVWPRKSSGMPSPMAERQTTSSSEGAARELACRRGPGGGEGC